jgi:enoyl-CoA hydratase/carnithine racemase
MNVLTKTEDGVGTITFNRLDRRNALSVDMLTELSDTLDAWAYDDEVAAVVITGGEDFFCAGLDLNREVIRHPEVVERINAAYRAIRKDKS